MSPLSIAAAAHRLRGNVSFYNRSVPLFLDAAENCCKDIDDANRTQSFVEQNNVNYATAVRYHSCYQHFITPINDYFSNTPFTMNKREYHSTSRNEILPLIAVGLLGATTVYTYRALQQMDKDWDDYYNALEEYKAATGMSPEKDDSKSSTKIDSESGVMCLRNTIENLLLTDDYREKNEYRYCLNTCTKYFSLFTIYDN